MIKLEPRGRLMRRPCAQATAGVIENTSSATPPPIAQMTVAEKRATLTDNPPACSAARSHWSDESLCCHLSPAPRAAGTPPPPRGRRAETPAERRLSVYPLRGKNPSPFAVWCWIRAAPRQRACQTVEWINAGRFAGLLCCVVLLAALLQFSLAGNWIPLMTTLAGFGLLFFFFFFLFSFLFFAETMLVPLSLSFPRLWWCTWSSRSQHSVKSELRLCEQTINLGRCGSLRECS